MPNKKPKFLQRSTTRYSKLGKGRKLKQRWKKPNGRDNKMREKRRGYAPTVSIGYSTDKTQRKEIMEIHNLQELEIAKDMKNKEFRVARIGKKKREEIIKKAEEMKIKLTNAKEKRK